MRPVCFPRTGVASDTEPARQASTSPQLTSINDLSPRRQRSDFRRTERQRPIALYVCSCGIDAEARTRMRRCARPPYARVNCDPGLRAQP